MGRRCITIRQDLLKSLAMVAGKDAAKFAEMTHATDAQIRTAIEAAFGVRFA